MATDGDATAGARSGITFGVTLDGGYGGLTRAVGVPGRPFPASAPVASDRSLGIWYGSKMSWMLCTRRPGSVSETPGREIARTATCIPEGLPHPSAGVRVASNSIRFLRVMFTPRHVHPCGVEPESPRKTLSVAGCGRLVFVTNLSVSRLRP